MCYSHVGCCSHHHCHCHHNWWYANPWCAPAVTLTVAPVQPQPPTKIELKVDHLEIKAEHVTVTNPRLSKKKSHRW